MSGTIGKGDVHHVLNDFAMRVTSIVNAGTHTGYFAQVKREHDGVVRYAQYSQCIWCIKMLVYHPGRCIMMA